MRSDRDERTETEREIDDFLKKFETPADELSADITTYMEEQKDAMSESAQTFSWKKVVDPEFVEVKEHTSVTEDSDDKKDIIVNEDSQERRNGRKRARKKR